MSLEPGSHDADAITPLEDSSSIHNAQARPLLSGAPDAAATSTSKTSTRPTRPGTKPTNVKPQPTLRYRKRSLCIVSCYLPFLIVPWILTCILTVRPLSHSSYYNQQGDFGPRAYLAMIYWMGVVRVLNAISSVLTIPITSAVLAQGAVVYSQRRKLKQKLNLRQVFAFADRAWSDIPAMWSAMRGNGTGSNYLWLAAGLLVISKWSRVDTHAKSN